MGARTSYEPGTFSWTDLGTTDADAAKSFYGGLLGWEFDDRPIPDGGPYSMAQKDGGTVAALYAMEQRERPPAWAAYVTVESTDDGAAKAAELGASLVAEPFDVLEAGRMAVIQDPTGAVFCVWEPRTTIGAELVNTPGAITLNQLNTDDPERAQAFYAALFDWRFERVSGVDQAYWGIYVGDRLNAGMLPLPPDSPAPSHWLVYFGSDDVDADAARIGDLGGTLMVPPMGVPGGRIVVAQDPQGAAFALFSGRFDD
jgi:predicted enzyme related to lactoylglutathione lyase